MPPIIYKVFIIHTYKSRFIVPHHCIVNKNATALLTLHQKVNVGCADRVGAGTACRVTVGCADRVGAGSVCRVTVGCADNGDIAGGGVHLCLFAAVANGVDILVC